MLRKFEIVSKYKGKNINLPKRQTRFSAGYDIEAACDITIPSIWTPSLIIYVNKYYNNRYDDAEQLHEFQNYIEDTIKPTLVPTGIKVKMPRDNMLLLYNRSSNPLKRDLILANGVGVIDSDYYNNENNEGEILGSFYNFGIRNYHIKKGDRIVQGIFQNYALVDNDDADCERKGGFGSTE